MSGKWNELWVNKKIFKNEVTPWKENPVKYKRYSVCVDLPGGFWRKESTFHMIEIGALEEKDRVIRELVDIVQRFNDVYEDSNGKPTCDRLAVIALDARSVLKKHSKGASDEK